MGYTSGTMDELIIAFCHMAPEVATGLLDPSSITSLNPLWLAVLIAEGEEPSRAWSPPSAMDPTRDAFQSNASSSSIPGAPWKFGRLKNDDVGDPSELLKCS